MADTLVIAHHFLLTPSSTFEDAANALITTDQQLNNGRNVDVIRDVFVRRGILPNPKRKNRRAGFRFDDTRKPRSGGRGEPWPGADGGDPAVLFDLGNTLLDEQTNRPLPGATELLDALGDAATAFCPSSRSGVGLEDAAEPVGGGPLRQEYLQSWRRPAWTPFSDRWRRE